MQAKVKLGDTAVFHTTHIPDPEVIRSIKQLYLGVQGCGI